MKKCKNCYLPKSYPNIKINHKGICNYCIEKKYTKFVLSNDKKAKLRKDFEKSINDIKGKNKYDCVLLFSGGKDSTYLLHILKERYKLNVLTITIETGLENINATENIKKIIKYFDIDHKFIILNDFYKKFYRHYLLNHKKETYCEEICKSCQNIMKSAALKIAAEEKIPFIFSGLSPDQIIRYEIPKEELYKSWIPKQLYNNDFSDEDRNQFWNPKNINKNNIPQFIMPFAFIEYPSHEKMINIISKYGLTKKKLDQLKTNCHLLWLMMYLDIKKYEYNTYMKNISMQIRSGKIKNKMKYYLILTLGIWLFKKKLVKWKNIKHTLNYLNVKLKDI